MNPIEITHLITTLIVIAVLIYAAIQSRKEAKRRATALEELTEKVIASADRDSPVIIQINGKFVADAVEKRIDNARRKSE